MQNCLGLLFLVVEIDGGHATRTQTVLHQNQLSMFVTRKKKKANFRSSQILEKKRTFFLNFLQQKNLILGQPVDSSTIKIGVSYNFFQLSM